MHGVLVTPTFQRQSGRAKLSEDEVQFMIAEIARAPGAGDLIPESGGLRKLRFAREGSGKSGGYRTVHFFAGSNLPIFLLGLIDKRERGNLSKATLN